MRGMKQSECHNAGPTSKHCFLGSGTRLSGIKHLVRPIVYSYWKSCVCCFQQPGLCITVPAGDRRTTFFALHLPWSM